MESHTVKKTILFITAYKDINRNSWRHFKRSNDEYFRNFKLLADNIDYKLIVYVEDNIKQSLIHNHKFKDNIIFYNLNDVDTFFKKYNDINTNIINSNEYKKYLSKKFTNVPERFCAEYNSITNSKINFITHSKKLHNDYDFYAWIDFGCCRNNINCINNNIKLHLLEKKIYFHVFDIPNVENKIDDYRMLTDAYEYFDGSQFIIHTSLVEPFEILLENKIKEWQRKNVTDDDQSLTLQVYYNNSDLFQLIKNNTWFSLYANL
jgi:hypothetical protein